MPRTGFKLEPAQGKGFVSSGFYPFTKTVNFSEPSFPIYKIEVGRGKLDAWTPPPPAFSD